MVALAAVMAQLKPSSYPYFRIASISIMPSPEASATAEPVMPEKMKEATTLTWPIPPLKRPTKPMANSKRRSVTFPVFITFAVNMKSGTAMMMNLT